MKNSPFMKIFAISEDIEFYYKKRNIEFAN